MASSFFVAHTRSHLLENNLQRNTIRTTATMQTQSQGAKRASAPEPSESKPPVGGGSAYISEGLTEYGKWAAKWDRMKHFQPTKRQSKGALSFIESGCHFIAACIKANKLNNEAFSLALELFDNAVHKYVCTVLVD